MNTTLRALVNQAERLVRTEVYDEAIALCHAILRRYPRYARCYRILGEAYLGLGEHEEAANLFRRALGVDPEDPIAYAGLGIVFEERGLLEEAIWQFERAYELAPGREELRREVARLYEERGSSPTVQMTRAALARLYARGGLWNKAIGELQDLLAREPYRLDLQTTLARTYWRAGRRAEAAEVAQTILDHAPNCLAARLILGTWWSQQGREQEGESLLTGAQELDPENREAARLLAAESPLPLRVARMDTDDVPLAEDDAGEETAPEPWPLTNGTQAPAGEPLMALTCEPVPPEDGDDEVTQPAAAQGLAELDEGDAVEPEAAGPADPAETEPAPDVLSALEADEDLELAPPAAAGAADGPTPGAEAAEALGLTPAAETEPGAMGAEGQQGPAEPAAVLEPGDGGLPATPAPAEGETPAAVEPVTGEPPAAVDEAPAGGETPAALVPVTGEPPAAVAPVADEPPTAEPASAGLPAGADMGAPLSEAVDAGAEPPALLEPVSVLQRQLDANPQDHEARLALARALVQADRLADALPLYDALAMPNSGFLAQALADLEAIARALPDERPLRQLMGDAYARAGQFQEAMEMYRWLIEH